jgi:hypothetical protein
MPPNISGTLLLRRFVMPDDIRTELATDVALALYRVLERSGFSPGDIERLQASDTPVDALALELAECLMVDRRLEILIEDARHWLDVECVDG